MESSDVKSSHHVDWQGMNLAVVCLAIFAGAFAFRIGLLGISAEFDELYHLLAARNWIEDGTLRILDGEYTRGAYFTKASGLTMMVFGETLTGGRLLNVFLGSLIPVLLFVWVRHSVGFAAAIVTSFFAIFWPQGVVEAQTLRFYTPQVLVFLIGAFALYHAYFGVGRNRFMWLVLVVVAWAIAIHLQITSVVGIAAAIGAVTALLVFDRVREWRDRLVILGLTALLALVAIFISSQTGILEKAISFYRWTPLHAEALRDYEGYYHDELRRTYGLLWFLTPVAVLTAGWAKPKETFFALAIFAVCFLVHSFGGMKSVRYLSYAMPLLFMIWAIALVTLWEFLAIRTGPKRAGAVSATFMAVVFMFSNFFSTTMSLALGEDYRPRVDWSEAQSVIGEWMESPLIVTSHELHTAAYVGDFDIVVARSRVSELDPPEDFSRDFRTGRVTIGEPESVASVLMCWHSGVIITTVGWWNNSAEGRAFEAALDAAGLMKESRVGGDIIAVRWTDPADGAGSCDTIPAGAVDRRP